jgi:hypothetical protein
VVHAGHCGGCAMGPDVGPTLGAGTGTMENNDCEDVGAIFDFGCPTEGNGVCRGGRLQLLGWLDADQIVVVWERWGQRTYDGAVATGEYRAIILATAPSLIFTKNFCQLCGWCLLKSLLESKVFIQIIFFSNE